MRLFLIFAILCLPLIASSSLDWPSATPSSNDWPSLNTDVSSILDNVNAHEAKYHVLWASTGGGTPQCPSPTLSLVSKTYNSITVSWSYDQQYPAHFELQMATGSWGTFNTIYTGSATQYTANNLQAGTTYKFRVRLLGNDKCTDSGFCIVISVTCDNYQKPPPCQAVHVVCPSPVEAICSWQQPSLSYYHSWLARNAVGSNKVANGIVRADAPKLTYKIKYTSDGQNFQYVTSDTETAQISGLQPDTTYTFYVATMDESGQESDYSPSTGFTVKTLHSTSAVVKGDGNTSTPGTNAAAVHVAQNDSSIKIVPFGGIYGIVFWCAIGLTSIVSALWACICCRRRAKKSKEFVMQPADQLQKAIESATGPVMPVSVIKKTGRSRNNQRENSIVSTQLVGNDLELEPDNHAPLDLQSIIIADSGMAGSNTISKVKINSRSSRPSKNRKLKTRRSQMLKSGKNDWSFNGGNVNHNENSVSESSMSGISRHDINEDSIVRADERQTSNAWRYV